jgi:hypothetical protein
MPPPPDPETQRPPHPGGSAAQAQSQNIIRTDSLTVTASDVQAHHRSARGRRNRRRGADEERAITRQLQEAGVAAEKVSRSWKPGPDLSVPLLGRDLDVEVKIRGDAFKTLYGWLVDRDALILRANRERPLVVVRLDLAIEVMKKAEGLA